MGLFFWLKRTVIDAVVSQEITRGACGLSLKPEPGSCVKCLLNLSPTPASPQLLHMAFHCATAHNICIVYSGNTWIGFAYWLEES